MQFIQLGKWFFAVEHIVAINLNTEDGGHPCVALWMTGDKEPWYFRKESPEAQTLIKWARLNSKVLVGFEEKR